MKNKPAMQQPFGPGIMGSFKSFEFRQVIDREPHPVNQIALAVSYGANQPDNFCPKASVPIVIQPEQINEPSSVIIKSNNAPIVFHTKTGCRWNRQQRLTLEQVAPMTRVNEIFILDNKVRVERLRLEMIKVKCAKNEAPCFPL
ncbi:hypothetical protein ACN28S_66530 [Cystobacter fuscus]